MNDVAKKTVLIVEDNASFRASIQNKLISKYNCDVSLAASMSHVKNYGNTHFDFATIDGMDGEWEEIYKEINADRKIVYSFNPEIVSEARSKNIEAYRKRSEDDKFFEVFQ